MARKEVSALGGNFELSYEILNREQTRDILFLHGWGSNKEIMKQSFGAYFPHLRHIYLDMPGFGASSNDMVLGTHEYAEIVARFLVEVGFSGDYVVGHSFGGKVATLLKPKNLVLLSSAGIVLKKPLKVRTKIMLAKMLKNLGVFGSILPSGFLRSDDVRTMSQNMYETFKRVVDEDFSKYFSELVSPVFIFWGKNDRATPLGCGVKICSLAKNSVFYPLDGDHFFFVKHGSEIEKVVIKGIVLKQFYFRIFGKVQGVGYRKFAHKVASEMGLRGYVRNLDDGSVEAEAILDEEQFEAFLNELKIGSVRSSVERVEVSERQLGDLGIFEIRK